ncbi:replication-relaxation family protein [Salmonella enterica]|nr:replication-relaxation family protein [Salmonella enterica]
MTDTTGYRFDHSKRMARNAEKQRCVLRFLREEYCAPAEIVARLLGVSALPPVYRFLNGLTEKGFLRCASYLVAGRNVRVWGLTPHGAAFALDDDEAQTDIPTFQPSKVSAMQLLHRIDLQRFRLLIESRGATGWRYVHQLTLKGMKQPDALATVDGKTVAFEMERTVKSRKRYAEIVSSYLFNRKVNGIEEIWYICPDAATLRRVQGAILAVDEIVNPQTGEARKTETLDRERLFAPFKFKLLETLL